MALAKSAKIVYTGGGVLSVSRSVTVPAELVALLPDAWTNKLVYRFRLGDDKYNRVFTNEFGSFRQAFGASRTHPVGRNASFTDNSGKVTELKYWGYVQEDATGKYVPGWCTTAIILGHPDKCAPISQYIKQKARWYANLPVGTDIRPILRDAGYVV